MKEIVIDIRVKQAPNPTLIQTLNMIDYYYYFIEKVNNEVHYVLLC